ncbi:glycosyltransferase family 2 protein [Capnocytophaga stomatis]|uniref:Glycosyltransferase family 2 protein n=1 Tax=Capnocytophaga stomatis TaxID=1848904 RepID=A0ABW8Q926_9FLAO|nr:glycosyltransferase family 2 protein [Capnocytophaga stomatis]GIJ94263.1 glycosyl transferase [Capnocytophaga stomatis]
MKYRPLISVITVSFNAVKTIEQTILSVINQTYPNVEYIIIDGGSTDGTIDIIKKYQDKIAYWVSEPDKGIYNAMNKGIEKTNGDWINFMNAGDEFYNNDVLNKFFTANNLKEVDVIYGNMIVLFPKKTSLKKPLPINHLEKGMPFCHQSTFVKSNLQKKYLFNTTYRICADYKFFFDIYKKGAKFKYKDVIVSKFLYGGLSSSSALDLLIEERHISGKKHNRYFLNKFLKELLLGRFYEIYRKYI